MILVVEVNPAADFGSPQLDPVVLEERRHRGELAPVERPLILSDHHRIPVPVRVAQPGDEGGGVPGGAIGLVWNGMMRFGGSWFFLTASELIIVGGHRYTLPGVGSYVGVAVEQGQLGHVVWGIITMIVMILAVNVVFWRPLIAYVERFRLEQTEASQMPRSVVLDTLRRSSWQALAGRGGRAIARPVNQFMGAATGIDDRSLVSHAARRRTADIASYRNAASVDEGIAGQGPRPERVMGPGQGTGLR